MLYECSLLFLSVAGVFLLLNFTPSTHHEQKWTELSQDHWEAQREYDHAKDTGQYNENQLKRMNNSVEHLLQERNKYWE